MLRTQQSKRGAKLITLRLFLGYICNSRTQIYCFTYSYISVLAVCTSPTLRTSISCSALSGVDIGAEGEMFNVFLLLI